MRYWCTRARWSPFLVGALIGILFTSVVILLGYIVGLSTPFAAVVVWLISTISEYVAPLISKYIAHDATLSSLLDAPKMFFYLSVAVAIMCGAYVSARLSRDQVEHMPPVWRKRFGNSLAVRYLGAFFGGIIVMVGARIAGGCTSGHAIAGGAALATSGFLFMSGMFVNGVVTAYVLYVVGKK
jgi:uncharacterized protein